MKHFVTLPYLLSMYSTSSGRGFLPLVTAAHEISPSYSCKSNPVVVVAYTHPWLSPYKFHLPFRGPHRLVAFCTQLLVTKLVCKKREIRYHLLMSIIFKIPRSLSNRTCSKFSVNLQVKIKGMVIMTDISKCASQTNIPEAV